MKLNRSLLEDIELADVVADRIIDPSIRGLYDPTRFVLRLRPDIHRRLKALSAKGVIIEGGVDDDDLQAMSTYFHETIHWWQFMGSTSGLIMSLSFPSQIHSSLRYFKEYLKLTGHKKPIAIYNINNATEYKPKDREFMAINHILNNFHDIYFYKVRTQTPEGFAECIKTPFFESLGHAFHITYATTVSLLAIKLDEKFSFLPDINKWVKNFDELTDKKEPEFYYGSGIGLPSLGALALYEGQARFNQMLYLHIASNKTLDWDDFAEQYMLEGLYIQAFDRFLNVIEEERPGSIDSPLVALFLLLIDIAINPTEGFPFDIDNYKKFIHNTDPGIRFEKLCHIIKTKHPEFKGYITDYSSEQYWHVSNALCNSLGIHSPQQLSKKVSEWCESQESIIDLLKQDESFDYEDSNIVISIIFARFLRYQSDKLTHPDYFCWPGLFMNGERLSPTITELYIKHQPLFKENDDLNVSAALLPGISEEVLMNTSGHFYSVLSVYELCRQWIFEPGEFNYNFHWLTYEYSREEMELWVKNNFKNVFGVMPENFELITPKA